MAQLDDDALILRELSEKVEVVRDGKVATITKQEFLIRSLFIVAGNGNSHAADFLTEMSPPPRGEGGDGDGGADSIESRRHIVDLLERIDAECRQDWVDLRKDLRERGATDELIGEAFGVEGYIPEEQERRRHRAIERMRALGVPEDSLAAIADRSRLDTGAGRIPIKTGQ